MASYPNFSGWLNGLIIFLIAIPLVYATVIVFTAEKRGLDTSTAKEGVPIPFIGLSLCSVGFAGLTFLFVNPPHWLGANPISWSGMIVFALAWAIASSLPGLWRAPIYIFSYMSMYNSQLSTDLRPMWMKVLSSEPRSLAIATISITVALLLLAGSLCSMTILESRGYVSAFCLLLSAAILGLLSHGLFHAVL